jgi:cholinesterase
MIRALAALLGVFLSSAALCTPPDARRFEALYAFGDSLSDSGAGYLDGNGPTAVAYLASDLGIAFTYAGDANAAGKSLNFAVSGARTGRGEGYRVRPASAAMCGVHEALLGRGMLNQVDDFAQRVRSGALHFDAAKTLFFIAGGLNDQDVETADTVAHLKAAIRTLYAVGGRDFLIALLPTQIPPLSAVGRRLNAALIHIPQELRSALPRAQVSLSRWGEYFDEVLVRPADYGITNTTTACAGRALFGENATPCQTPDTYYYYHSGHPSTAVQRIVARRLKQEVEAFP